MAQRKSTIKNNGNTYTLTPEGYYDPTQLFGTGANTGRYETDVTAALLGIRPYTGPNPYYEFTNQTTGEIIRRPQTWTAEFSDGSLFDWPTYEEDGVIKPWSRYDQSINLAECIANGIILHVWKDERKRTHLEIAASEESVMVQQPMQQQAPQYQQQPQYYPQQQQYQQPMQQQYYPQQQGNWRQPNQNYGAPF